MLWCHQTLSLPLSISHHRPVLSNRTLLRLWILSAVLASFMSAGWLSSLPAPLSGRYRKNPFEQRKPVVCYRAAIFDARRSNLNFEAQLSCVGMQPFPKFLCRSVAPPAIASIPSFVSTTQYSQYNQFC